MSLRKYFTHIFIFCLIAFANAQIETPFVEDCASINPFLKGDDLASTLEMVDGVNDRGAIYFDNNSSSQFHDFEHFYFSEINDQSTHFELVNEHKSKFDEHRFYRRYQQYYNGVKVSGSGYTEAYFRSDGPPGNPCFQAYMAIPFVVSGLDINTLPIGTENDIASIVGMSNIEAAELEIVSGLVSECTYTLTWKVLVYDEGHKQMWIDAATNEVLKVVDADMHLNAKTVDYGWQSLDNFIADDGASWLMSPNEDILVYGNSAGFPAYSYQNIGRTYSETSFPDDENHHPEYQAFYIAGDVIPAFDEMLDINFGDVHIAVARVLSGASVLSNSTLNEIYLRIGTYDERTLAVRDILAHELAHVYVNQFIGGGDLTGNLALTEGLCDVIATYIESGIQGGNVDWILGDDGGMEIRNLQDPSIECYEYDFEINSDEGITSHNIGLIVGHWYYILSKGNPAKYIVEFGLDGAIDLLLETLPLLNEYADIPDFMNASLIQSEEMYGLCSPEYASVVNAWELLCVNTGTGSNTGNACDVEITGSSWVCEESEYAKFCIYSGVPNAHYNWTISGPLSTQYESVDGMNGNSQNGGDCLTLIAFPKYPYYPRYITIKVYSSGSGSDYIVRKRLKLVDCDNDDPTCEEYYGGLRNATETNLNNPDLFYGEKTSSIMVYDAFGRTLYTGEVQGYEEYYQNHTGVVFIAMFDRDGQFIRTEKRVINRY